VNARLTLIVAVIVGGLGLAGLLLASLSHQQPTAFSVNLPAGQLTAPVGSGQQACQGPVRASSAFGGVRLWVWPVSHQTPGLMVQVRDRAGNVVPATMRTDEVPPAPRTPAGDILSLYPTPTSRTALLTRPIAPGQDVTVCVRNLGPGTASLMGAPANGLSGRFRVAGRPRFIAMSLLFLRPHSRSLLSLLPTAFRRAALFRPTWVGAWTFWMLGLGLLLGFGLAAAAVVLAVRADAAAGGGAGAPPGAAASDPDPATGPRASA
jgi:hypothetical protein